jgi:hypothetical protein
MKKITLLFMAVFSVLQINAQVSSYVFTQSSGTYTEIAGDTQLGIATANTSAGSVDDLNFPVTLPFSFTFNGSVYTDCNVSSNGFITFGTTLPATTNYTPISSTTAYAGSIAAWGGDINALFDLGGLTGNIVWGVTGTAPNREFVLQYRNFRPVYATSTALAPYINFQIILSETSNTIKFVYGPSGIAVGTTNSSTTMQIGLRGATNTDFKNRTNATNVLFTSSTAGALNTSTQAYSSVDSTPGVPTNGLTYTWSLPTCSSPSNILYSNITSSSATVTWTESVTPPANGYEYYYSTNNTAPTNATVPSGSVGAGITTANLSSLSSASTYYFWVRSVCSDSDKSEWTSATSFITPCTVFTPSFTENFTTFPPNCWSRSGAGDVTTGPTGTGTGIWAADGFLNVGTTGAVKVNLYSLNRIGWLITPTIDMSAGNYRVSFDYGVTTWNGTTTNAMGSDDRVQLLASQDGGATWTTITTFDASSNVSNTLNTFSLDLPSFTSATTLFALYATDGTVDDTPDYDFFIDNFAIQTSLGNSSFDITNFSYYPNPVKNTLNLSYNQEISNIEVFNFLGQKVISNVINANAAQIDMSNLSKGAYMVRVTSNNQVKTIKVIKE